MAFKGTIFDREFARQALSETQARFYEAVYKHMAARLSLSRATGVLKKAGIGGPLPRQPQVPEAP